MSSVADGSSGMNAEVLDANEANDVADTWRADREFCWKRIM